MRELTVLHPSLSARYVAVVSTVAGTVEAALPPAVCANRVARWSTDPPALRLAPWRGERVAFLHHLRRLAGRGRPLLVADVRHCYGSITPGVVEDSLRRLGAPAAAAREVGSFLARLRSLGVHGLPVGPDPSAVLANAVLVHADAALAEAGARHLRWVDDVVVRLDEREPSDRVLAVLRVALAELGLELNHAKTRVVPGFSAIAAPGAVSAMRGRPAVG